MSTTYGVAYATTGPDFEEYKDVMLHEMGHAYGKLWDEYAGNPDPYPEDSKAFVIRYWEQYEWCANIDFTNDHSKIKWKQFIGIPKYSGVGAFEGASRHMKGVWRPEVLSIMRSSNYLYFNAPSREQLYKRTMILSGSTYSFEEFVAQDNVTPPPLPPGVKSTSPKTHLNPPIIITETK